MWEVPDSGEHFESATRQGVVAVGDRNDPVPVTPNQK